MRLLSQDFTTQELVTKSSDISELQEQNRTLEEVPIFYIHSPP